VVCLPIMYAYSTSESQGMQEF
jgi:hypothetical protein